MCGFAAFFEPGRSFPARLIEAAGRDLYHRGPDSGASVGEPGFALAFRRLAILDPGPRADQPMEDAAGRFALVFNGEIYNWRALRAELEAKGTRFRTRSDSEVLIEGYRRWGEGLLERLEGMYAFVLVDRREGRALAARDPFGIKPLYLLRRGRLAALASEMRPLLRLHPSAPDEAALAELLVFGWAAGEKSNLEGIERVPGGTALRIDLGSGEIVRRRFCDPLSTLAPEPSMLPEAASAAVDEALRRSVEAHLQSDVGYALQLSGGVDSSLIAALTAEAAGRPVASFAVSLGDHPLDEGRYRAMVTARYPLDHHEIALDGRHFADAWPRAVRHMEGPVPHLGCVMLMLVCEEVRGHTKVVLTGEGADEMFGGYERYALWRKLALQERLSRLLPAGLLPRRPPFLGVRRLAGRDGAVYASVYQDLEPLSRLFPGLVPAPPGAREAASRRFAEFRDRLFAVDQTAYLESLLVRQDKMAMAASVEARVPYVHLPLARLLNRLPRAVRAPGGVTKPLLKHVAGRYLAPELLHRRKNGLLLPYAEWLADEKGLGRYLGLLDEPGSRLAAYAERGGLQDAVRRFRRGARAGVPHLARLVNIELWLRSVAGEGAMPTAVAAAQ